MPVLSSATVTAHSFSITLGMGTRPGIEPPPVPYPGAQPEQHRKIPEPYGGRGSFHPFVAVVLTVPHFSGQRRLASTALTPAAAPRAWATTWTPRRDCRATSPDGHFAACRSTGQSRIGCQ
jgi:hypothetical protein